MKRKNCHIVVLLVVSVVVRAVLAGWMELGNDEAYYWVYAKHPDWSHFDHPGMVGWMMQLFSLNLLFDSELFIRLSSIFLMTVNTWLVYRIGKELKDEATGFRAALLYTASIYAFVITGIFILPDTPLSVFWLLGFLMLVRFLRQRAPRRLLWAGLFIGLSILSKYTGAFLWFGFLLYLAFFDRKLLKSPYLYLSIFITLVCCLPILIWNFQNDFISFRFHGERVGLWGSLRPASFGRELAGECFYNNPVNFVLAMLAVAAAFKRRLALEPVALRLILLIALPMIGLFWLFSLTRDTLPHWTGPAYNLLLLLSAVWLGQYGGHRRVKAVLATTLGVLALTLVVGVLEIKTGFIPLDRHTEACEVGKDDFTLDLYGWRQVEERFAELRSERIAAGEMKAGDAIIGNNWFPMASIDYYVARPLGMKVLGYGPLDRIHKYQWVNEELGGFEIGANYWYLADSHYFIDPEQAYAYVNFHAINLLGVIPIERNGKVARNIFVYECKKLVYGP